MLADKLLLAEKYQDLQQDHSECEDIGTCDVKLLEFAAALDQLLQLWRHIVIKNLTFNQELHLHLSAD